MLHAKFRRNWPRNDQKVCPYIYTLEARFFGPLGPWGKGKWHGKPGCTVNRGWFNLDLMKNQEHGRKEEGANELENTVNGGPVNLGSTVLAHYFFKLSLFSVKPILFDWYHWIVQFVPFIDRKLSNIGPKNF